MKVKRLYVIVLDSFGVGALPDAAEFGDGSDVHTLRSIMKSPSYVTPHLEWLGLFHIDGTLPPAIGRSRAWCRSGRCPHFPRGFRRILWKRWRRR